MLAALALFFSSWVVAILWVGSAHVPLASRGSLHARLMLLASGLTIALGVASVFGLVLLGVVSQALGMPLGGA